MPLRTLRRFSRNRGYGGDSVRISGRSDGPPPGVYTLSRGGSNGRVISRVIIGPRNFRSRLGPVATTGKGELELQAKILRLALLCRRRCQVVAFAQCPKDTGRLSISLEWGLNRGTPAFDTSVPNPLSISKESGGGGFDLFQTQVPYHPYQERRVGYMAQGFVAAEERSRRTAIVTFTGIQLVNRGKGIAPLRIRRRAVQRYNLARFIDHAYDTFTVSQTTPLGPPRLMDGRGIVRRTHWWYR